MKKKIGIILIIILILIIIIVGYFIVTQKNKGEKLESRMTAHVSKYFDENIKGRVIGMNKQIVTLLALKEKGFDVSLFEKNDCSFESFSYVLIENPHETNKDKIKYSIENHLNCKNYKSSTEKAK